MKNGHKEDDTFYTLKGKLRIFKRVIFVMKVLP